MWDPHANMPATRRFFLEALHFPVFFLDEGIQLFLTAY